ncbi:unnamed protein product [Penicillium salamii]|uniref:Amidohydrolase-related domain-containing protein n=1 Tax=Penicillium salamii TaxID=1612424 RepID=A0A9W4ITU1_9EURO|nr:unnamed protein product [Penicillium salamii]CAG8120396.1 unnamed protein product [Penicillium salamii]CAG8291529.1 unnamed protein product [Penicillium salamii]CAG8343540.1 unnamed protein product [Penicillium salamii]CAG8345383.1 unnamed protein product [Penicillium salamii]
MENLHSLRDFIRSHPHIDSHAHTVLNKDDVYHSLETIASAANGNAVLNSETSLPSLRVFNQLSEFYGSPCASWSDVEQIHEKLDRDDNEGLIRRCVKNTDTLLLDDYDHLKFFEEAEGFKPFDWHDRLTTSPTKRIVQIEGLAEAEILHIAKTERRQGETVWDRFRKRFLDALDRAMGDQNVVAFKTVICSRTGLNVDPHSSDDTTLAGSLIRTLDLGTRSLGFKVEDKPLCDWLVQQTLKAISLRWRKPGARAQALQFDVGLGDRSMSLERANPACLQPLIAQYSMSKIVLLHSAYPFTREAGYLASVYDNVYLCLGGPFPMISREGQEKIIRESLELTPTNRLLWGTDTKFHPEGFWLANLQFRQALEKVLVDYVQHGDLTIDQAKKIARDILFDTANTVYNLRLR